MNPHQQNKIDISSLSPDEQRLLRLYGKIPNKKDLLQNKLKERKYFDSGDYALSKAGKASDVGVTTIGSRHPLPENIPHLTATSPPQNSSMPNHLNTHTPGGSHNGFSGSMSRSPVREHSILHRRTSAEGEVSDDQKEQQQNQEDEEKTTPQEKKSAKTPKKSISPPRVREGLPIRR